MALQSPIIISTIRGEVSEIEASYSRRLFAIDLVDNTQAPPTEVLNDRYVLDFTGGTVHADWDGASKGDIVEFNGTLWVARTPTEGFVLYLDAQNRDAEYTDDGSPAWTIRNSSLIIHNNLSGLQGGSGSERYHLTLAEHTAATRDATNILNGLMPSGKLNNWDAAFTHVSNNGSDHSFIDQDVTSGSAPTFTANNLSDGGGNAIITTTQETNFEAAYTHVSSNGSDHTYIDQDVTQSSTPLFVGVDLTSGGLDDDNATSPINLTDGSNPALNTTNKTLVGGINEVYGDLPQAVEDILTVSTPGQTAFTLSSAPSGSADFALYLNGQLRRRGTDYTQSGTSVTWLDPGGLTLVTADILTARYNDTSLTVGNIETFSTPDYNANLGNHRVRSVAGTGAHRFNFEVPSDFNSIVECKIFGIVSAGAAGSNKDIDLISDYGARSGEISNQHTESDTTTVYDFTGLSGKFVEIDLTPVLSSLSAGDSVGVFVDHNAIGGAIGYKGIRFVYSK